MNKAILVILNILFSLILKISMTYFLCFGTFSDRPSFTKLQKWKSSGICLENKFIFLEILQVPGSRKFVEKQFLVIMAEHQWELI